MLPLLSGGSLHLETDNNGQFAVEGPTAARFKFSSSYEHSRCIDSVTGVSISFPMIQVSEAEQNQKTVLLCIANMWSLQIRVGPNPAHLTMHTAFM
jgi:hypothetical protein